MMMTLNKTRKCAFLSKIREFLNIYNFWHQKRMKNSISLALFNLMMNVFVVHLLQVEFSHMLDTHEGKVCHKCEEKLTGLRNFNPRKSFRHFLSHKTLRVLRKQIFSHKYCSPLQGPKKLALEAIKFDGAVEEEKFEEWIFMGKVFRLRKAISQLDTQGLNYINDETWSGGGAALWE